MYPALAAGGQTGLLLADLGRFRSEEISSQLVGTSLENHSPAECPNPGVLEIAALSPSAEAFSGLLWHQHLLCLPSSVH